jgi:hypothetical protein
LLSLADQKAVAGAACGKTLPKLYHFFTDYSFREVKTGPKLTVSGMIFRSVREIGPKLTEIGMNFKFLLCQDETETPECFRFPAWAGGPVS